MTEGQGNIPRSELAKLNGRTFERYHDFASALCTIMNSHVNAFPPGYEWKEYAYWSRENNWITINPNRSVTIHVSADPHDDIVYRFNVRADSLRKHCLTQREIQCIVQSTDSAYIIGQIGRNAIPLVKERLRTDPFFGWVLLLAELYRTCKMYEEYNALVGSITIAVQQTLQS